jgi:ribose transport system ATP-binding protein
VTSAAPLLEARGLRKEFPGVLALDGVSLRVMPGEALAVVGENGAGKSTLMKLLAGLYPPDAGEMQLAGQPYRPRSVADALDRGVVLIHQELNLAENLSIEANLFLGREKAGPLGWLLPGSMSQPAAELLRRVGLAAPPSRLVGSLPPGQRQMVEIARALSMNARLIIMDEPTSSLTQSETEKLYEVCDGLKRDGVAVLYISHRLAEVRRIASRVTVLRDGRNAGELAGAEVTHDNMVRLMVGRDLRRGGIGERGLAQAGPPALEVKGLEFDGGGPPVTLSVRGGEVLGMAGLVGAGRTELAEALFGLRRITGGEVLVEGVPCLPRHPRDAIAAGVALVPEDRRKHGLVTAQTVRENLALPNWGQLSWLGLVLPGKVNELCCRLMALLRVKAYGPGQPAAQLSGGNQQKVVLGKWLARTPRVLILDEPTRGVDVGARGEIYALMDDLARRGVAILMISSDMEEVLGVSSRVAVMHEGRLAGLLERDEVSEEAVMQLATGGTPRPGRGS